MHSITLNSILAEIKNKWKFLVLITIIAAIGSSAYFYYNPPLYSSTIRFLIDEEDTRKSDQNLNDQNIYLSENSPKGYMFYQIAKSTEMFDYLIKKFDLYKHYGISLSNPMHYETITNVLNENISITNVASGGMSITFTGRDRALAAEIANEAFFKLEDMVKEYAISNMQRKIKIYDEILNNSTKDVNLKSNELKNLIEAFNQLISTNQVKNSDLMYDINLKLTNLSFQISSINQDLFKTIRNHEVSLAVTNKENIPNVKLISKALRDTQPSIIARITKYVVSFTLFILCFSIVLIVLYKENKEYEMNLFNLTKSTKSIKMKQEN
jgi:hypothetical protein